ncbi:NAD(P)/FAD-dependent oxidoreductase [Paraburkholderia sp. RL17-337-BIB-A]|jgi:thioredoxin reductase (NADPH)|uniref:hypothetical protein n=1 Tax=Paraburkholderia sp. RL17-337-BIB-A TaxID=3031636 RepID=UPI0038BA76D3
MEQTRRLAQGSRREIKLAYFEYRVCGIPAGQRLPGASVFCSAAPSGVPRCSGKKVFIIGDGDTAEWMAMNSACMARTATLIVRVITPAATLSHYLRNRLTRAANIGARKDSSVAKSNGAEQVEAMRFTCGR